MPIMAIAMAQGTVREGFFISPLGISAHSTPVNAKIKTMAVRATLDAAGISDMARFEGVIASAPTATSTRRGRSFATASTVISREPCFTPVTLTAVITANAPASTRARADGPDSAGTSAPTKPAQALATLATAVVPSSHSSTPAMNPAKGPNATAT
jgi:hypothetical protein